MNLLGEIFNIDKMEIMNKNRKYLLSAIFILIIIILLLNIKIENYYQGFYSNSNEKIVLLVEKEYVDSIRNSKNIFIDNILCDYSVEEIEVIDNNYLVCINVNIDIKNNYQGNYKVYLGKEKLFKYLVRIIKD